MPQGPPPSTMPTPFARLEKKIGPGRWPFYYGWVIVAIAFLGAGITSGVALWGASVFVLPMTEEFGWSRASFFAAFTVRAAVSGIMAPVLGPVLDTRHGARIMALVSAVVLTSSMMLLRYTDNLFEFILLFGVAGAIADLGSGFTISAAIVPKWFVAKRGRALGITIAGVGLGATVFPGSVTALVEGVGWRDAWLYLGVVTGSISFVLAMFVRARPEDMGLLPDGATAPSPNELATKPVAADPETAAEEVSLTRSEALRTRSFWMLLAAFACAGFGIMGFQTNWLPFLLDQDFTGGQASLGILFYGVLSGVSRPVWGYLGERVQPRYLLGGSMIVTAFSVLVFLNIGSLGLLIGYMIVAGVSMGGFLILQSLLTANYFGRAHLGAVTTMMRPATMVTAALSPLLIGALYDLRGGYTVALLTAGAAWLLAGLFALAARPPAPPRSKSETENHGYAERLKP
jgi:MFS family permease